MRVLLVLSMAGLLAGPGIAEARGKRKRAKAARVVKAPRKAALTADDPLLRVGVAKPLTAADAHQAGKPVALASARPSRR